LNPKETSIGVIIFIVIFNLRSLRIYHSLGDGRFITLFVQLLDYLPM